MSAIFLPRRWRNQPQGPVELAEPYRDALIAWTPQYEYGRFGRAVLTGTTNTIENGVGAHGRNRRFGTYSGNATTGLRLRYPDANPLTLLGNRGVTCIAVAHKHSGSNVYPGLTKLGTSGSVDGGWALLTIGHASGPSFSHWGFQAGNAGTSTIQEDGVTGQTNNGAVSPFAESEACVVIGTWNRVTNKQTLWIRSLATGNTVRAEMTATSTTYKNASCPHELLGYYRSTTSQIRSWTEPAYLVSALPRHVSDAEAQGLLDNPWQIFRAPSHRLYFSVGAGAPSASTGTLDASEAGADAAAITGAVLVDGSLAATESGADVAALAGTVLIDGALAATESGSDVAALAGDVLISGAMAAQESGADVLAASGGAVSTGALAAQEAGSDTAAATGSVLVAGALDATEAGADTVAATGAVRVIGAMAAAESGADTLSIIGEGVAASATGSLAAQESGADSFAGTGTVRVAGALAVVESGADTLAATGALLVAGTLAASETGSDTAAATGRVLISGALAAVESGAD
ncbi:MAG: variable large family protein, partial [Sulfuricaulis sp.]|nr:variable large family protein [Sulfuricaulis sp.]